jgi:3',5'-cyclic AMP phosphodiesterase CpdA
MSTLTWLHLSDLHFRTSELERYNANVVLDKLLDDVKTLMATKGFRPDVIFFTGDVAFSGDADEYRLAGDFFERLLETIGYPGAKERLFLVPGNHDVHWEFITYPAIKRSELLTSRDVITQTLLSPDNRRLFLRRLDNYAEFVNDFFPKEHLVFDDEHYFYVRPFEVGESTDRTRIAILGLNSAWVAHGGEKDAVVVGEAQAKTALDDPLVRNAHVRIVLLHHPFDQLRESDQEGVERLLEQGSDFILVGHRHEQKVRKVQELDRDYVFIPAGAAYEGREKSETNAYNLVSLDLAAAQGTVYLREYSHRAGIWVEDHRTYGRSVGVLDLPDRFKRCKIAIDNRGDQFYNRDDEVELVRRILRREDSRRGVVVHSHGEPGWGKSSLLQMLQAECSKYRSSHTYPLLFNAYEVSVRWDQILRDTAACLGIDRFRKFWALLDSMLYSKVGVQTLRRAADRQGVVNTSGAALGHQNMDMRVTETPFEQIPGRMTPGEVQRQLTDLFVEEMEALTEPTQVVWLVDTVESVEPETQVWLSDMLGRIARQETGRIILIVAGRNLLPYDGAWRNKTCELALKGLPGDAIRHLVEDRGIRCDEIAMKLVVDHLETRTSGNPLNVCSFLDSVRRPA